MSELLQPQSLLYSINARIGGYGLDLNAHEALKLAYREGFLGEAVAYANRQTDIPAQLIHSLRWHPVRLLSFLDSPFYYAAKKRYLDRITRGRVETGKFDLFHTWEGDGQTTFQAARRLGIPTILEIPTWHRDKGKVKPRNKIETTRHEREAKFPETLFKSLIIKRPETLDEYDHADLLLVPSECSARTFTAAGIPREKLFMLGAGADVHLFQAKPVDSVPSAFTADRPLRAIFCGALIKRKGIHVLLEAWHRLKLPHATLTLVGAIHKEAEPYLQQFADASVKPAGFTRDVPALLREADLHIFPSECEGSAKTVYEACAAGLAQISTFETGDVVQDGLNGRIVPCNDVDALARSIQDLYDHPETIREYCANARHRAETEFTWDHFRQRLAQAYDLVLRRSRMRVS